MVSPAGTRALSGPCPAWSCSPQRGAASRSSRSSLNLIPPFWPRLPCLSWASSMLARAPGKGSGARRHAQVSACPLPSELMLMREKGLAPGSSRWCMGGGGCWGQGSPPDPAAAPSHLHLLPWAGGPGASHLPPSPFPPPRAAPALGSGTVLSQGRGCALAPG